MIASASSLSPPAHSLSLPAHTGSKKSAQVCTAVKSTHEHAGGRVGRSKGAARLQHAGLPTSVLPGPGGALAGDSLAGDPAGVAVADPFCGEDVAYDGTGSGGCAPAPAPAAAALASGEPARSAYAGGSPRATAPASCVGASSVPSAASTPPMSLSAVEIMAAPDACRAQSKPVWTCGHGAMSQLVPVQAFRTITT